MAGPGTACSAIELHVHVLEFVISRRSKVQDDHIVLYAAASDAAVCQIALTPKAASLEG